MAENQNSSANSTLLEAQAEGPQPGERRLRSAAADAHQVALVQPTAPDPIVQDRSSRGVH
jgi:hypothetical protein